MPMHPSRMIVLSSLIFLLFGCQTAYYSTMEKLGVHKVNGNRN